MRKIRILATAAVFSAMLFGYNSTLFSWGLFNLFSDTSYTESGLKKAENFDPDRDILYLPKMDGKSIFQSANDLSICRKKDVRKYIYIYLTSGREYLKKSIERSYIYRDIIDEEFRKNEIPPELSLLPLLESGFNPNAVSRSRAIGLWQFVSNTSTPLGLRSDRWVEERRDIQKSTQAAIRHLKGLYKTLGSWDLVLAAYNGGCGQVSRAMKKTGAKNIWELIESGVLTRQTSEYVPRFIAMLMIYKNQRLFGISDEISVPRIENSEYVVFEFPVDLKKLSRASGVSIETIKSMNPELNSGMTPPYTNEYVLRMPSRSVKKIEEKMDWLRAETKNQTVHRVKKGECVASIARQYKKKLH